MPCAELARSCRPTQRLAGLLLYVFAGITFVSSSGCQTGFKEYVHNGFKVGPNYCAPAAPVSELWIDYHDGRISSQKQPFWDWWRVFNDPYLETLVQRAHQQNLSLREAGFRIQEARARRAVAAGNLFPQSQTLFGSYRRQQISTESGIVAGGGGGIPGVSRSFDVWQTGGQLAWELDFWGRFRRALEVADAQLDASVEDFDDVLVVLLGDVAASYVEVRTLEQRLRYARSNVRYQTGTVDLAKVKLEEGAASRLDVAQAVTNVAQTEATIPQLETQLRQAQNRLCVLMGIPPQDLSALLDGEVPIPQAPAEIALGVPADLLRRRPDVRQAERLAAAQSARVGIAETSLYPAFSITGTIFVQANELTNLFTPGAVAGNVGPSFNWNVLNYGRIVNTIDAEEAVFMQRVTTYQNTVLNANREVEDAIVAYLRAQEQARILREGVAAAVESRDLINDLYKGGRADFGRVFFAEFFLVQQQDLLAQAEGAIAGSLVEIYRALGGGWQIRVQPPGTGTMPPRANPPPEEIEPAEGDAPAPPPTPEPERD
jgi:NodT family efflux transporter outer membrane factor (OMF) lipoprotein